MFMSSPPPNSLSNSLANPLANPRAGRFARIVAALRQAGAACGCQRFAARQKLPGKPAILRWSRLRRLAARFVVPAARAAEPRAGAASTAARRTRRPPKTAPQDATPKTPRRDRTRPPPLRLTGGFGSLLRLLPEAAESASELRALLADPDMQALLAMDPRLVRELRPLCRMLAVALPPELAAIARVERTTKQRAPRPAPALLAPRATKRSAAPAA